MLARGWGVGTLLSGRPRDRRESRCWGNRDGGVGRDTWGGGGGGLLSLLPWWAEGARACGGGGLGKGNANMRVRCGAAEQRRLSMPRQ
jgi:hypothetical protein